MTVRRTIGLLGRYPGDLRVVVDGYENGCEDLTPGQITVRRIALGTGLRDWLGRQGDGDDVSPHSR